MRGSKVVILIGDFIRVRCLLSFTFFPFFFLFSFFFFILFLSSFFFFLWGLLNSFLVSYAVYSNFMFGNSPRFIRSETPKRNLCQN